jgi:C1A family cysteine protease
MVGGSFSDLDSNGICGWDRGPGNHCVYVAGMDQVASQWVLDMTNSWGTSFGEKGHGFITQKHIESVEADSYAIRCEVGDPQDPNMPPVAA